MLSPLGVNRAIEPLRPAALPLHPPPRRIIGIIWWWLCVRQKILKN